MANKENSDFLEQIKKEFQTDKEFWGEVYKKAQEDANFLSDDVYAQWDEADYAARINTGRPAITIDHLSQFVHQVVNDIRINTPVINVIPAGYGSDKKIAEAYKGIIRGIEYASNADNAYDTAVFNAVKQSIGFIRVDHGFVDDESFDQELIIKRVHNPLSAWIDSASVEPDGSDAKRGFIIDKITVNTIVKDNEVLKTLPKIFLRS